MRRVLFQRDFQRFQGGHMKVLHYFQHVRDSGRYEARIRFTPDSVWNETNPWYPYPDAVLGAEEPPRADVLFLAGGDWRMLEGERWPASTPVINLVQDFRATRPDSPLHEFLARRAVRVCVTAELQEALAASGRASGPLLTVPVGVDVESLPRPLPSEQRDLGCVVLAVKAPELGADIAARLRRRGHAVALVAEPLPRAQLIDRLARSRVAVLLPGRVEGAYMPPLEAMALGSAVVCPDCVGNRSFCRDGETCLVPPRRERAIAGAAEELLRADSAALAPMLEAGARESDEHALARERERFLEILDGVQALWEDG